MDLNYHFLVAPFILMGVFLSPVSASETVFGSKGIVNMQGAIIDSACTISPGNNEQSIDMGSMPISYIEKYGYGNTRSFFIELKNCSGKSINTRLSNFGTRFQIGFDGASDGEYFRLGGEAQGVALQIVNENGGSALPGAWLPLMESHAENMVLNFGVKLISNKKDLHAGVYYAAIRFKLGYY